MFYWLIDHENDYQFIFLPIIWLISCSSSNLYYHNFLFELIHKWTFLKWELQLIITFVIDYQNSSTLYWPINWHFSFSRDHYIFSSCHVPLTNNCNAKHRNHSEENKPRQENVLKRNLLSFKHVITLEDTNSRSNKPIIYSHSKHFFLKCDNHMLHLSVKIIIPYKGLHVCLAIIPEEYNIIIYCHREWQWETKKRQWSGLVSCNCSYSMCMLVL